MTLYDQLHDVIHAEPFVPFSIRMSNDRIYHVDHPELAMVAPRSEVAVVTNERGSFVFLLLQQIASVEPQAQLSAE